MKGALNEASLTWKGGIFNCCARLDLMRYTRTRLHCEKAHELEEIVSNATE